MLHRLVAIRLDGASDSRLVQDLLSAPGGEYRFQMCAAYSSYLLVLDFHDFDLSKLPEL